MNIEKLSNEDLQLLVDDFIHTDKEELIHTILEVTEEKEVQSWLTYIKEQLAENKEK